ncbi:GerAB/ArcD/ProY family transporter [Paenibacillus silvisoli]|uniref:GerAB/ArcD/ProY family transporter n=1 Tax=Paenibacillus silvisoli TaxID=3110539 RepID=UPI00280656A3|nr:GerAB/ArcD/ProY family transporter [Paenibacillus silvisoli]
MNHAKLPLGPIQLFCLLFQAQFGLGVLSLPHSIDMAESDGWIACLFGGLLNIILVLLVCKLVRYDWSKTVFQMLRTKLGPYVGSLLLLAVAVYSFTICYETLANWIFLSNLWAYEKTPAWMLTLLLVGGCALLVYHPIRVFARFSTFAMAFVPVFVLLICYTLKDANLDYVLPVFAAGPMKIGSGAWNSMMSYVGVELLLVLAPCVQMPPASVLRVAIYSNIAIMAVYMLCTFSATAIFGSEMVSFIHDPLLFQFKTISFKMIERTDLLVLTMWILFIMTTLSSYYFLFVSAVTSMWGSTPNKRVRLWVLIAGAVALFVLGEWQLTVSQLTRLQHFIGLYVPAAAFGLPILMLLMMSLSKRLSGGKGVRT